MRIIYTYHIEEHRVKILFNSDKNCRRSSILKKNHHVTIMTQPVTWRHRDHAQSIAHGHFPISCPLEPSRYLASRLRYLAPKLRQRLLRDEVITVRHLEFGATGSRSIRSAVPENPTLGWNTKSIGRSVAEIWPFETLNLMTSLMMSQGPDPLSVRTTYIPQVMGSIKILKISASSDKILAHLPLLALNRLNCADVPLRICSLTHSSDKNSRRRSILKMWTDR